MHHLSGKFHEKMDGWILPERLDTIEKLELAGANLTRPVQDLKEDLMRQHEHLNQIKLEGTTNNQDMPIKTKPFAHQRVAFQVGTSLDASALLMEMGTGKTLTAIAVAGERHLKNKVQFLLVICPASVVPVWPREFAEHANYPHRVVALIAKSAVAKIELVSEAISKSTGNELTVIVVNFESAWRIETILQRLVKNNGMIIVDESQRIKTPGAEQSKCLHRLAKYVKYRMILSGTPITQSPLDLYSQYKFLEPSMFGGSYTIFRNRYAVMGGFEGRQVVDYKNLDHLMKQAHSIAYRITKNEALDLPTEMTIICPVILPLKAQKMYQQLKRDSILELEKEYQTNEKIVAQNVLTKLLRLQQLTGGNVTSDEGTLLRIHDEKLIVLQDELETILDDQSRKVVIFARFLAEIDQISTMITKDLKVEYRVITGAVDQAERGEVVQEFQTDPEVRVIICQIQTAGLGITLTAADTAIFYSMDFSLANHEQAKARIHRIGQRHPVTYKYLLAQKTVDEKIFEALKSKKSIADLVIDDWRSVLLK